MASFGERLRQQREMRGISLDEIVASTKIGRRLLQALEEEQFDLLPGGIFNKAYVRAYAKCVGIDEDQAVADYLEAAREPVADPRFIAQQQGNPYAERPVERAGFPLLPVVILLLVAAAGLGGWTLYQNHLRRNDNRKSATAYVPETRDGQVSGEMTSTAPEKKETPSTTPASTTTTAKPASPLPVAHGAAFEVTVRPKSPAWIAVKADGKYVVRGILRPPEARTIHASNEVVVYTGNAGAVEVAFNGRDVPLPGGLNQPQTVVLGAQGVIAQPAAR